MQLISKSLENTKKHLWKFSYKIASLKSILTGGDSQHTGAWSDDTPQSILRTHSWTNCVTVMNIGDFSEV